MTGLNPAIEKVSELLIEGHHIQKTKERVFDIAVLKLEPSHGVSIYQRLIAMKEDYEGMWNTPKGAKNQYNKQGG